MWLRPSWGAGGVSLGFTAFRAEGVIERSGPGQHFSSRTLKFSKLPETKFRVYASVRENTLHLPLILRLWVNSYLDKPVLQPNATVFVGVSLSRHLTANLLIVLIPRA